MPYYPNASNTNSHTAKSYSPAPRLLPQEVAFILQISLWQVQQMRRKGQRLRAEGQSNSEIIEAGGLPPTHRGNFASEILPFVKQNPIAVLVMTQILDGTRVAPWTADPKALPTPLASAIGRYF
jgi:hypothetical protein